MGTGDKASSQYKNKHSLSLLKSSADELNLSIIRTCGAAGLCKEAIDAMSIFSVKNILRKVIATHSVFFKNYCDMVAYLASKNQQYYYRIVLIFKLNEKVFLQRISL